MASERNLKLTARPQRAMRAAVANWHRRHGRQLPWRGERDPYRVWLREIMLQQTTVTAVIPYLERFLTRFPTVQALAEAEETEVLRLWEGLGYYSRARNLHRAAIVIVGDHKGQFPGNVETLQSLPGVGRYTAGAIASFSFDLPAPIIEANTLRLHTRLLGFDGDPRSAEGQKLLWKWAEQLVSGAEHVLTPGDMNQALMDLGATVCTPASPRCPECPLKRWCMAFHTKRQNELPRLPKRVEVTRVTEATVAVRHRGRYLLRRRPEGERWAGLWDFPRFAVSEHEHAEAVLIDGVRRQSGLTITPGPQVAQFEHGVTRYRITLRCFTASLSAGQISGADELAWVKPAAFAGLPLSTTGRKFATLLTALVSRDASRWRLSRVLMGKWLDGSLGTGV